jgi:hypothetical protein
VAVEGGAAAPAARGEVWVVEAGGGAGGDTWITGAAEVGRTAAARCGEVWVVGGGGGTGRDTWITGAARGEGGVCNTGVVRDWGVTCTVGAGGCVIWGATAGRVGATPGRFGMGAGFCSVARGVATRAVADAAGTRRVACAGSVVSVVGSPRGLTGVETVVRCAAGFGRSGSGGI